MRQRRDALTRVSKVDSKELFPIRRPAAARRTLILGFVLAAMFVYRAYYGPPVAALLQTTARSHLLQSVLKPLSAIAKDSKKAMALVKKNPEASEETQVTASDQPPDDLWRKNDSADPTASSPAANSIRRMKTPPNGSGTRTQLRLPRIRMTSAR